MLPATLAFEVDREIEPDQVAAEEQMAEIDDRAGAIADDAAQFGDRRSLRQMASP